MLSQRSQPQNHTVWFCLTEWSRFGRSMETESRQETQLSGLRAVFEGHGKVLETENWKLCNIVNECRQWPVWMQCTSYHDFPQRAGSTMGFVFRRSVWLWFFSFPIARLFTSFVVVVAVQSLCCVRLFGTPWTAACQASLSFTTSQSLLKLMSIESVTHPTISSSVSPFEGGLLWDPTG